MVKESSIKSSDIFVLAVCFLFTGGGAYSVVMTTDCGHMIGADWQN